jgi:hypothetical protein
MLPCLVVETYSNVTMIIIKNRNVDILWSIPFFLELKPRECYMGLDGKSSVIGIGRIGVKFH